MQDDSAGLPEYYMDDGEPLPPEPNPRTRLKTRAHSYWSRPRIALAISVRVLLVTLLFGALGLGGGLLLALMVGVATTGQTDFVLAYSRFGLSAAFRGMIAGFAVMLVAEARQLRPQPKPGATLDIR